MLLVACSPVDPKPSPNAPAESLKPAEPNASAESLKHVGEPDAVVRTTLVGVVHEGGTQLCTEPYEVHWVDRSWAVGFVPLVHDAALGATVEKLEGKVVRVSGLATNEPATLHEGDPRPEATVPCGQVQMRSDWELWPKGTRARRGEGPELAGFRIEAVEAVVPFRGSLREDDAWFSVTNPFDRQLREATLVAHYEGCYGKPGTAVERRPLGTIEAGATLEEISVPQISMRKMSRGHEHRLDSIQLVGTVESGALDLDVEVRSLGLDVGCPKRK